MHTTTPFVNMHTRNVEYLAICLHLWLAISYSASPPEDMRNVQTCEGITEYFPWNDDTQNLRKVQYFFKNNYIAKSSSPNFSSVTFIGETLKYRLRVLEDDNVAFQIDNVTTADSGEYMIILTYSNGHTAERIGRLDVKEHVLGNFNITCKNDAETGGCTCGKNTGSDLYKWVFEGQRIVIPEKTTNESKLELRDFPKEGSFFCIRLSDCKKSNAFEIQSGERTTKPTPTPTGDTNTIVLGVLITIGVIVLLLGVLGLLYWRRKKRAVSEKPPVNVQYVPVKRSSDATNDTCNPVETSACI